MSEKSHVSLEAHVCPVCGDEHETGSILLDKRMQQSLERVTVTGASLCAECKAQADKGYIAMVEIDKNKSGVSAGQDTMSVRSAYRTGNVAWMQRDVAEKIFEGRTMPTVAQPVVYVEVGLLQMLESKLSGEPH